MAGPSADRRNNFALIRLAAALQVMLFHWIKHLGVDPPRFAEPFVWAFTQFPRVPVFFMLSGFLLAYSYEHSASLRDYVGRRARRIYPGLLVCFAITLGVAAACGFLTRDVVRGREFALWVLAQTTFAQSFNPSFMRGFGVGVINGSIWTIPVELAFYVALPILTLAQRRLSRRAGNLLVLGLGVASFVAYCVAAPYRNASFLAKLVMVSPAAHFFMFLVGMALRWNFTALRPLVEGRGLWWCGGYLALSGALGAIEPPEWLSLVVLRPLLGVTIVSLAYSARDLAARWLRGHDLSYGIFLYHMLPVNLLIHFGWRGSPYAVLIAFPATILAAALSWWCVERRFTSAAASRAAVSVGAAT